MSCERNANKATNANRGAGIVGQSSRYLNTLGSWSTYKDLDSPQEVPDRVAEVTESMFGIKGILEGKPRLTGVMGAVIGVQALEQVSGGVATAGMRMYARGKPVANYRGVLIRKSPFAPRMGKMVDRLTGGRLVEANGYYFFEKGKSWHTASMTVQVGDMAKTLTRVQSLSLPAREFYFDRPVAVPGDRDPKEGEKTVPVQRVIDIIKGDEDPDTVPGFMGSTSELDGVVPMLKTAKQSMIGANWLLRDQSDWDEGMEYTDYGDLVGISSKNSGDSDGESSDSEKEKKEKFKEGLYKMSRKAAWPSTQPDKKADKSTTKLTKNPTAISQKPYGADLFRRSGSGNELAKEIKDRVRIDGRDYPLAVTRVVRSPITGVEKAEAMYYDQEIDRWREITEEEEKVKLAKAVRDGQLSVVDLGQ